MEVAVAPPERETKETTREGSHGGSTAEWSDGAGWKVALGFRVKVSSRESAAQKTANVFPIRQLLTLLLTYLLFLPLGLPRLQEPCLLSHIRFYKSVLEWEPDALVKVRPRCEAPKRDMMYPTNHTPCRYVRISCLRGSPVAIFFIQVKGILNFWY